MTLARSLVPLLEREPDPEGSLAQLQSIVQKDYPAILEPMQNDMYRAKLGLARWDKEADEKIWPELQALLGKAVPACSRR